VEEFSFPSASHTQCYKGNLLLPKLDADVPQSDSVLVDDDSTPWTPGCDDINLSYAGHRCGLVSLRKGQIPVSITGIEATGFP